ncbi:MAG: hypothetical protein ACE5MK_11075 [Acidobacteriota bacterium]
MGKAVFGPLTVIAIVVCLVASAHGSNSNSLACLRRAHSTSVSVQRQFQQDLQRLVVRERPGLKGVAAAGVDTQMAYFDVMGARFTYLFKTQPARIEGIIKPNGAAVVFDWSDEDTTALLRADPRYEQLEVRWLDLKTKTERHPDRSKLLNYIQSSKEFRTLSVQFAREHHVVKEILEQCRAQ